MKEVVENKKQPEKPNKFGPGLRENTSFFFRNFVKKGLTNDSGMKRDDPREALLKLDTVTKANPTIFGIYKLYINYVEIYLYLFMLYLDIRMHRYINYIYIYMNVCICKCMYLWCIYKFMMYTFAYVYISYNVCIFVNEFMPIYICGFFFECMYICMFVRMSVHICMFI